MIFIVLVVLFVDQASKVWIKLNMTLGQEFWIFGLSWARIHFIENPGMAFGHQFGGEYGKLFLTLFRITAATALIWWTLRLIKKGASKGFIACLALILAGALGNILDSVFYGLIFSASSMHTVASFLPEAGGYASLFHGKVVDLFYFPLIEGRYPAWFPWLGGDYFLFFRPVFNVADSAISVGIALIFIFQKRFFKSIETAQTEESDKEPETDMSINSIETESSFKVEHNYENPETLRETREHDKKEI